MSFEIGTSKQTNKFFSLCNVRIELALIAVRKYGTVVSINSDAVLIITKVVLFAFSSRRSSFEYYAMH